VGYWAWNSGFYPYYVKSKDIFFCPSCSRRSYFIRTSGSAQTSYFYWPDCDGKVEGYTTFTYYKNYMGGPTGYNAPLGPKYSKLDRGKPIMQDSAIVARLNLNHARPDGEPAGVNCLFFEGNVVWYPHEQLSNFSSFRIARPKTY